MKKLVVVLATLTCTSVFAQSAEQMKEVALEACKTQAASIPEAQRASVLNTCECTAENTDYELVMAANTDPETMQKVQEKAMEVAQKCASQAAE